MRGPKQMFINEYLKEFLFLYADNRNFSSFLICMLSLPFGFECGMWDLTVF